MKSSLVLLFLSGATLIHFLACSTSHHSTFTDFVNPLVGTDSEFTFSNGNTYPAAAMPFGMTAWTPSTNELGNGWIYQYKADKINGIKATHQPSPWIGDYGDFSIMPMTGEIKTDFTQRASRFSHDRERAQCYYYTVDLLDYNTTVEVAPTTRCAHFRITYPETEKAILIIDAHRKNSEIHLFPNENKITGITRSNRGGVPNNFACYFVVEFNTPFTNYGVWTDDEMMNESRTLKGEHVGAFLHFPSNTTVTFQVGTSFISHAQAWLNLKNEIGGDSFEHTKTKGRSTWENELKKIKIEGATDDQKITFYTAFYRVLLFPRIFYEFDQQGLQVHYSPYDGAVHAGPMYADNGFWDTFRAVYPFFTILFPERDAEIIRGWINAYREGGWFPKWTSPGYRNCMIGTHVESLVADAYFKGIRDFDIDDAYAAMKKDGTVPSPDGAYGRVGIADYIKLGYVPSDKYGEATARTLEFAYDDFCITKMARDLGYDTDAGFFGKQMMNYKNVWHADVDFMWGRFADGSREPNFSKIRWGNPFTEGSTWHYSWSVLHDINGLIHLMGGRDSFCAKLDEMLTTAPEFDFGHYGFEIHEMTEMVACKMGQYAHGNQPVHHVLYLWNYAGQPWKTQNWVRHAVNTLYGPGPDGLCGDEDNGQMSAWYIFSTLGFYPVCPGEPMYVIGSPLFEKATLFLPNGEKFEIVARGNAADNVYIESATLNETPWNKTWIAHEEIARGGRIEFLMAAEPNEAWASEEEAAPFSVSK
ncbi:glycoside hydrolase family 92 protein [candidate division KSB1 bacterium]|nr:GH92 family glycosyl hydrolase [candidate division KSB1 bacterium]RQW01312.1 MAG: glycoside hydrolase family 92 protein [candidate division KSB1 bacterium]